MILQFFLFMCANPSREKIYKKISVVCLHCLEKQELFIVSGSTKQLHQNLLGNLNVFAYVIFEK